MADVLEIGLSNAAMAAVLTVLAAGLCRLYRRPTFAHGLWLVVLLKLVTPPLVPVPLPWFDSQEPSKPGASANLAVVLAELDSRPHLDVRAAEPPLDGARLPVLVPQQPASEGVTASGFLPGSWCLPIFLVWLAGSVCVLAWIARSVVRFQRLLRFARKADPDLQDLANELAGRLKLARRPDVWLVPGKVSPMLWALGARPRLIFPAELLERPDREQLRTILLHELAHWRRRDHWVRLLELAVMALYWWHPAVWWARSGLRQAEEECCDAWVVATLEGADRAYAMALLETVAFLSKARLPLPTSASGIGQVSHLRRRLTMIMSGQKRKTLTWAGCAGLLAFGMLLLPLIPVRAQQPEKKEVWPSIVVDYDGDGRGRLYRSRGDGVFIDVTDQAGIGQVGNGIVVADLNLDGVRILLAGDDSPNKEAIELLKKALKILADKKQAPASPVAKPANPAELKNARDQVDALTEQVQILRLQLDKAQLNLKNARDRLAQLEGKPTAARFRDVQLELMLKPDSGPKKAVLFNAAKALGLPAEIVLRLQDGKIVTMSPAKKAPTRPEELKSRIERLLREVEALRREMQRNPELKSPLPK